MENLDFLQEILMTSSPSGDTKVVMEKVRKKFEELGKVEINFTNKGAMVVTLRGETDEKQSTFAAHVDTLGLMVKEIKPNGRLKTFLVGGYAYNSVENEYVTISNFVGTMYKFSGDIAVKNAPEDFVYYVPKDSNYSATFIKYQMKGRSVIGESKPTPDHFFYSYKNGSSLAYMTFMGGDARTVSIKTNTKNGRHLMILKDSYGNAIPGYLFGSFEEIHVVDFRYFHHSIKDFVIQNKITDILFANNLIHAYSPSTAAAYQKLLVRND